MSEFELSGSPYPSFLDLAEKYLRESGKALSAREITNLALQEGTLRTAGKTPWQTMKSKLSTDILSNGERSRFKRVFQGVFALREDERAEYTSARFIRNKLDEEIAVIPISKLKSLIPGAGLWMKGIDRQELARLSQTMRRRQAEETYEVVQIVSVFVVTFRGMFLTHMRSARLPENRLHGEYSVMLGGHVSIEDFAQLTLDMFDDSEDLSDCTYILRELSEELILRSSPIVAPRGFIYDESRDVSRQHLGLVYSVTLPSQDFEIGERGFLLNAKMETLESIKSRREQFENWSWTLMDNMQEVLGR